MFAHVVISEVVELSGDDEEAVAVAANRHREETYEKEEVDCQRRQLAKRVEEAVDA